MHINFVSYDAALPVDKIEYQDIASSLEDNFSIGMQHL